MSAGGHLKTAFVVNTVCVKLLKLVKHGLDIDNDAIAEKVVACWVQNTARKQVEGVLVTVSNDGVASVSATIESSANVVVLGKDVDEFAFALVTPLGAENHAELGLESS